MNDLLQHPRLLILLIILPIVVGLFSAIADKLGITRNLMRGRVTSRTQAFFLILGAAAIFHRILFLLMAGR